MSLYSFRAADCVYNVLIFESPFPEENLIRQRGLNR